MKPLISVIVPIYNVEAYLKRGVDSVLSQSYEKIEVILVDDGSTDGCPEICDEYAKKDSRIKVIHKENGGLSDARNAGMKVARGEYFAFLDSDDYFAPSFLEVLYDQLCMADADIAICEYEKTDALLVEDGPDFSLLVKEWEKAGSACELYDRSQLLCNQYETKHERATEFVVAWNKLYKASLFDGIEYPKGRIHEDEATTYKIFDRVKKGVFVKVPLYGYFFMQDSITRAKFTKKRLQWFDALDERITFLLEKGEKEVASLAIRARADAAIRYYDKLIHSEETSILAEKKRLRAYVKAALFTHSQKKVKAEAKVEGLPVRTKIGYGTFLICPALHKKLIQY